MKVSETIARVLKAEGVETAFSLLGDANYEVILELSKLGMTVHEARHEAAALAMADGYARTSRKPTVCAVTTGPAFAHTLVPLSSASRNGAPVVVLTGLRSLDDPNDRQSMDHQAVARLAGVRYQPILDASTVVERVRSALDHAVSRSEPVVIDVSSDVQRLEYDWDIESRQPADWQNPRPIAPDDSAIDLAVGMLREAQLPVVLAGAGAIDAADELRRLAAGNGALLATTLNARGLFSADRFNAGIAGLFSPPISAELFASADLVLSFGASLNNYTLMNGYVFPGARIVQVDVKSPGPMGDGEAADLYLRGDATAVAKRINQLMGSPGDRIGFRTEDVAARLQQPPDTKEFVVAEGEVDPRNLCSLLDELLPDECGWVTGSSGHFWGFPVVHMSRWRQPSLFSSAVGAIGYGLSVGMGAALGNQGRPVVVFDGDAGSMLSAHVFESLGRYRPKVLAVVMNDSALGAELHKMTAKGLDSSIALAPTVDIAQVAQSMGCESARVTDLDQLPGLVQRFLDSDGSLVLDVRVSRSVISQPFRKLFFASE